MTNLPVVNSVFDMSGTDDQISPPPEPFPHTGTDLLMDGLLAGVQAAEMEMSSDSGSVSELLNGDPYCPVTGSQRDGILDRTPIQGTTLIIDRGTYLPDSLKHRVLSSMRNEEWHDFSARLNYYLASKGYESMTTTEMMDIIWEGLRSKATEDTLMSPLRTRDVAAILKLRFDFSAGEID